MLLHCWFKVCLFFFFTVSTGRANFFRGNRYVNAGDDATRLIFDCDGSIAGMQATVREFLTKMLQIFLRRYFPVLCERYELRVQWTLHRKVQIQARPR